MAQDIREWLPGIRETVETFTVPSNLAAGVYVIEVAVLDGAGVDPPSVKKPLVPLQLGIVDRGADGWYALSGLTVD